MENKEVSLSKDKNYSYDTPYCSFDSIGNCQVYEFEKNQTLEGDKSQGAGDEAWLPSASENSAYSNDSYEIESLPTLHIEHDQNAFNRLRLHYALTWLVVLIGILVTVAVTVGLFAVASHSRSSAGTGKGIASIIVILVFFFSWLTKKVFSQATSYFKRRFLKGELEAFCEIDYLQDVKNSISRQPALPKSGVLGAEDFIKFDSSRLVNRLGLGADLWNKGEINDDFTGNYLGMPFRFLDVFLVKETRQGKSTQIDNIFEGQVFVFKTNLNIKKPIQYNYYKGNVCKKRSDFAKAFAASYYTSPNNHHNNPFHLTPSEFDVYSVLRNYSKEFGCDIAELETPDFVDNMLRMGQRFSSNLWGIRFDGDNLVLVLSRFLNVFELSRSSPRRSLAHLDKDMQEFVDILSIVSQMGFVKKIWH